MYEITYNISSFEMYSIPVSHSKEYNLWCHFIVDEMVVQLKTH